MDVLVPIDDTDSIRETVAYAIREFPGAAITVLHVVTPNTSYSAGMGGMYQHALATEVQREDTEKLFAIATETAACHGGSVATKTAVGRPVREILAMATESDADHIVVGRCGRSGLARLLFGSVTEGVVRGAAVPVTTV